MYLCVCERGRGRWNLILLICLTFALPAGIGFAIFVLLEVLWVGTAAVVMVLVHCTDSWPNPFLFSFENLKTKNKIKIKPIQKKKKLLFTFTYIRSWQSVDSHTAIIVAGRSWGGIAACNPWFLRSSPFNSLGCWRIFIYQLLSSFVLVLIVPKAEHFRRLFRGKNRRRVVKACVVHIKTHTHSNTTIIIILCQQ